MIALHARLTAIFLIGLPINRLLIYQIHMYMKRIKMIVGIIEKNSPSWMPMEIKD